MTGQRGIAWGGPGGVWELLLDRCGRGDHSDRGEDPLEEADDSVSDLVDHGGFLTWEQQKA